MWITAWPGLSSSVSTRGQYGLGPLVGARPKAAPEFIGATNRAHRRQARLAELDQRLASIARQRAELAARSERALGSLADLDRARAELPRTAPVARAMEAAARAAVLLTAARDRVPGRPPAWTRRSPSWTPGIDGCGIPAPIAEIATTADLVDAAERAVADFERAAADLVRAREDAARLGEELSIRRERIERLDDENDEAAEILAGPSGRASDRGGEAGRRRAGQRRRVRADLRRDPGRRAGPAPGPAAAARRRGEPEPGARQPGPGPG